MSSKAASLGSSSRPGVMGELGERVLEAPLEERRQFGSEPEVESRVADGGELREAVVAILEGAEVALELDAEAQDHHPEEGDGVDLAFATDEFGLVWANCSFVSEGRRRVSASSTSPGFRRTGRTGPVGCFGIP